jgi:hypothetical protein
MTDSASSSPIVAIVGGAVAGSEAAHLAASRGARVVVFEQNDRPWGKIEDGLPRWHESLRAKEFGRIDQAFAHPNITFVPRTAIGRDLSWQSLTRDLGFTAVVLANGAWRDRPLPVPGIDALVGRGFAYQNAFVYWFNHEHEADYRGFRFEIPDGAVCVGGGLASIDVVKIINYHLYKQALAARGVTFDAETFDKKGIPAICEAAGIDWKSLGIRGATLIYRRRPEDMPLVSADDGDSSRAAKLAQTRVRILEKAIEKFCINFIPLAGPLAVRTAPGADGQPHLVGMSFQKHAMVDGRLKVLEGETIDIDTTLVVSSIGSIPAVIEGVPMKGELYDWADWESGRLNDGDHVFGLGNVLTGKGNIVESRKNARKVMDLLTRMTLGLQSENDAEAAVEAAHDAAREAMAPVIEAALARTGGDAARVAAWVAERHAAIGYDGYTGWMDAHRPAPHH